MPNENHNKQHRDDLLLSVLLILVSVILLRETYNISGQVAYEPLGSAFLPRALSIFLIILALVLSGKSVPWMKLSVNKVSLNEIPPDKIVSEQIDKQAAIASRWGPLAVIILSAIYIGLMNFRVLYFIPATLIFIVVMGLVFGTSLRVKPLAILILIALTSGFGLWYIFGVLLGAVLPGM
jgi:hypothetical protein